MTRTAAYLERLGIDQALPPTLESLTLLHRRHLETVPYENLGIMLGRPPSVDPAACLTRVAETGRAGYCFHQNGALELVLRDLGFEVQRRHGHVWTADEHRSGTDLNHLVVEVRGLPTDTNPEGRWWPDVGLGEGSRDPLPLVPGTYGDLGLAVRITDVGESGWSYLNHAHGSFRGLEVRDLPIDPPAVRAAHSALSTPPEGHFTRLLVAQRRDARGVHTLRGCVLSRLDAKGKHERDVTAYGEWRASLVDELRVPLDDVTDEELRALWVRMRGAHEAWDLAGRP